MEVLDFYCFLNGVPISKVLKLNRELCLKLELILYFKMITMVLVIVFMVKADAVLNVHN